ncbi:hypothetical protein Tco_0483941 [Tanacetum coccineum]|uniref:Uncharacterized protein n=1 Tax=Tanacetum coccineum TaxID=301880 RepID=A0ABQ5DSJ9_9ASTR
MEFKVGDRVMLKVSPRKGVVRFGKQGWNCPQELSRVSPLLFMCLIEEIYVDEPFSHRAVRRGNVNLTKAHVCGRANKNHGTGDQTIEAKPDTIG